MFIEKTIHRCFYQDFNKIEPNLWHFQEKFRICLINMTTNIDMRLASARVNTALYTENAMPRLYTPGEVVTSQQGFMR